MSKRHTAMLAATLAMAAPAGAGENKAAGLKGNPGQYFGPDVYPAEAIRLGQQGRVVVGLWIDTTGKVASCTLRSSSGSDVLDQATCQIALDRVHFSPALDQHGRPIASQYTLPVRWVLPSGPVEMLGKPLDTVVEMTVSVDANGAVLSCAASATPVSTSPVQPCDRYPVGQVAERFRMTRDGKPVGGTVTQTMHQRIVLDP